MNTANTFDCFTKSPGRGSTRPPQPTTAPVAANDIGDDVKLVPIDDRPIDAQDARVCSIIELLLKDRPRLHELIRQRPFQSLLVGRLLAISLASFVLFGLAMSLVLTVAGQWPQLMSVSDWLKNPSQPLAYFEKITPGAVGRCPGQAATPSN